MSTSEPEPASVVDLLVEGVVGRSEAVVAVERAAEAGGVHRPGRAEGGDRLSDADWSAPTPGGHREGGVRRRDVALGGRVVAASPAATGEERAAVAANAAAGTRWRRITGYLRSSASRFAGRLRLAGSAVVVATVGAAPWRPWRVAAPPGTLENATTLIVPTTRSSSPTGPDDAPSLWSRVRSTAVVAKRRPPTIGRSFSSTATWRCRR